MPALMAAKPDRKLPAEAVINVATDPNRWLILQALKGDMTAADIAEKTKLRPANVQYHLKVLAKHGLVDEFPLPDNNRKYVYARQTLKGHVLMTPTGMNAVAHYN